MGPILIAAFASLIASDGVSVTSRSAERWEARRLYEELYCARGEIENRIKEQLTLFADGASATYLRSNQI
jgi:hypothetical protein